MSSEPCDYRQQEEAEMRQWLEEMDAKRHLRALEVAEEMKPRGDQDDAFRQELEAKHPWLKLWKESK